MNQVFYLIFFSMIDFSSICKCQVNENLLFLTIITFYLIYSSNIPHSNQNPSSFFLIPFFSSILFSYSYISTNGEVVTRKSFWHFFPCDFTIATETDLCLVLMTNTKYIVFRFQALRLKPNEYPQLIDCYGKAKRETHALAPWNMIEHWLLITDQIGNVFHLYAAIFEILM